MLQFEERRLKREYETLPVERPDHMARVTPNLPYLKELPKGKCICELDSTTDILNAKEILRDHMCIMGDVPASLLSIGKREDVEADCRRLISVVGEGGGFIISTGSICPIDARFENVKAMMDTGQSYRP